MDIDKRVEKLKKDVRDSAGANKERGNKLSPVERDKELQIESTAYFWFIQNSGFDKKDVDYSLLMKIDRENILKYLETTE